MTGNEYQKLAAVTIPKEVNRSEVEYHALFGMCSEVGELQGIYQKMYQGHRPDKKHMVKELGDLLWFVAEYCTARGWELDDIMELNIEKLKARYPEGFEAEKSLHRREGDV
jgi:NTP pyrophosphatase (non-canonical NTP hydrolase)